MKRHAFRWTIVALATLLLSVSAFAVPVTDDEAAAAAASLVAAGGVMDARMEGGVSEVRALTPPDGAAPFRVVKFADGGFVLNNQTSLHSLPYLLNLARVEPTTVWLAAFIHLSCTHF